MIRKLRLIHTLSVLIYIGYGEVAAQQSLGILQQEYQAYLDDMVAQFRESFDSLPVQLKASPKAHYQSTLYGSPFSYVTLDFSQVEEWKYHSFDWGTKFDLVIEDYLRDGHAEAINDGSEWTEKTNMHLFNCHAYTFRNLTSITPQDWLEGGTTFAFSNPVQAILDNLCKPVKNAVNLKDTPGNIQLINQIYDTAARAEADDELIYLLGFQSPLPGGASEMHYTHSGTAIKKNGIVWLRSKMGDSVMDMPLVYVNDFYSQINDARELPPKLTMSLYSCKSTGH